ncbi:hypothetical protein Patl1_29209 [Pistacia atlantica]|uniref:Uncharacterized protein n=1 Tax=Pistacia atlantica TaxID=434234 RepID=A0ACC1BD64_9ROSI|nr:hypothetical protein Patl1_29209 [Pistacia atlantica]
MAISCSTNQPLLLHFIIITILFSLMIPFGSSLSFNFSSFSNDGKMKYERPAYPDENGTIQLVSTIVTAGRATYNKTLPLWDKTTRKLTDFTTHFSFVIDSEKNPSYGDGLAFFLAPVGSEIPTSRGGGSFGLTKDDEPLDSTSNPFVAVEFDIYHNDWDPSPPSDHVGIDNSSMRSNTTVTWWSNIKDGLRNEAWITYNSSTQNLSVAFTGFRNNVTVMQYLDYKIDLRVLPELVTFGFSAATGSEKAKYSIHSWEFNSSLEAANPPRPSDNSTRVGLAVGLSIDPRLSEYFDEQQMQVLMIVGLWCAHPDENLRPSIRQAIPVLKSEAPLPVLPPKMPVPTYLAPSGNMPISVLSISYEANYSEGGQNLNQSSISDYSTNSSQLTSSSGASSAAALLKNTY